jgi:hypothetical protein
MLSEEMNNRLATIFLIIVFFAFSAKAQPRKNDFTLSGNFFAAQEFSFNANKNHNRDFVAYSQLKFGYLFLDPLEAGIHFNLDIFTYIDGFYSIGNGIYGRKYFYLSNKFQPFLELNSGIQQSIINVKPINFKSRSTNMYTGLAPGLVFFIKEDLGLEFLAVYNRVHSFNKSSQIKNRGKNKGFYFQFGFTYFLRSAKRKSESL